METDREIFLSIAELRRRYATPAARPATGSLTEFELRCFSQHGEDGVIAELLARIGVTTGFFVEFGIESGREGNCVFLADVLDWSGLFIEPDEQKFAELGDKYAANAAVQTIGATVTPENIEQLFARASVPSEPDILSIDVDGQDYWIWEALEAYRPKIVVIEYNAALPPGRQLVQPKGYAEEWDGTDYFGASLDALCALAERKGYTLAHTDLAAINAFFVRSDLSQDAVPRADQVARRSQPNYFMTAFRHSPDPRHRPYTDLAAPEARTATETAAANSRTAWTAPTRQTASELATRTDFVWHQRFELADGIYTPGVSDIEFMLEAAAVPQRLNGMSVLDIGTTNGGAAFVCERRGASRVVAVDIADEDWFGFAAMREFLGSSAQHVRGSIYELPTLLDEQFDVVLFWGVLYHLRHPLLALDNVRRLARGAVSVETAVADDLLGENLAEPVARYFRGAEYAQDSTIWFVPNIATLTDWCRSCGLEPTGVRSWPDPHPSRAMVTALAADPEWPSLCYEEPLTCSMPPLTWPPPR
jgi:SAM-dependent methyltransferase